MSKGYSTTWPECPEHPASHPLAPVNDGGGRTPLPKTHRVFARIGALADSTPARPRDD